ncbi:unnamed protein product [Angiostrongylus costaricensis]|uniref:Uncharacterized protein n=1 Tax=Angiostrongylus costaricensis TaxID=334426 RepID=A0A0R3PD00_ANGCS|nr:unnamed protein product [Angiostrongylus costaricensis]
MSLNIMDKMTDVWDPNEFITYNATTAPTDTGHQALEAVIKPGTNSDTNHNVEKRWKNSPIVPRMSDGVLVVILEILLPNEDFI